MNTPKTTFIRHELIAVLVGAMSMLAAASFWFQFEASQNELRTNLLAQAERRAVQLAGALSDQTELLLSNTDFALRELRSAWVTSRVSFDATVRSLQATYPDQSLIHVAVIGTDGYVMFSTLGVSGRIFAGDREHFRIHAEGEADQLHVSKPVYGRVSKDWNILISRPILRRGVFSGVMIVGLSPKYISEQLAKVSMSPGDTVVLLHNDGAFLARSPDWEKALGKSVNADRPFLAKDASASGVFQAPATLDQTSRIFGWHRLRQSGLILVAGLDQRAILEPFARQHAQGRWRSLAIMVVMLALGGGIALLLAHLARQQEALRKSRETMTEAQRIAKVGNWELNLKDNLLTWSDETFRIFEIDKTRFAATYETFLAAIHPEDRAAVNAAYTHSMETREPYAISHRLLMPDGRIKYVQEQCESFFDPNGNPIRSIGTVQDITERKGSEDQIHALAYFDALTNLPNRRLLIDRLGQALIASKRTQEFGALMILDLDNFKVINDTQGHDVGDRLLIEVAKRIVASVRQEDTISRLGGDEFVMMVERLGSDETSAASQADAIAEKIRKALNQPYVLSAESQLHHSTPSIGVTLFQGRELSMDVVLKQADMALYQAKGAGRNTVRFFNPTMQAALESRSAMEVALRNGLEHGEFRLFFQPQISHDGNLTGAEALLRWFPANQPQVSPAQFIPLAEETGLIIPIGAWVIQTACAQLKVWALNSRTRDLQIAVNVSARQFRQANFVEQVFDALQRSGANPGRLKLELTESVVLDNIDEVIARMQQIKALGVTFSLDDFGTGFSSLAYLKRLPLDQIKIDQSFVRDIDSDPNDAAIVRAIIAMGQSLGIQVIAEGVETEAQRNFLNRSGCRNYQGYLYGKPMPIEEWDRTL